MTRALSQQSQLIVVSTAVTFLTLLSILTFTGPYRWLVEWQLDKFGGYHVSLTALMAAILFWIPLAVIAKLYQVGTSRLGTRCGDESVVDETEASHLCNRIHVLYGWLFFTRRGQLFLAAIGLLAFAAILQIRSLDMNHLVAIDIEKLEASEDPGSKWLNVSGAPLLDAVVGVEDRMKDYYVPIVSSNQVHDIAVYAKFRQRDVDLSQLESMTQWQGVVDFQPLPAIVRLEHEKLGLRPAASFCVLHIGRSPVDARSTAHVLFIAGLVAFGLCLALHGVKWLLRQDIV